MAISLSAQEVTLLKRVSEGLLQPLRPDWLLTTPDLAADLQRLLSMDFIGTTRWKSAQAVTMKNAACTGRGPDMARVYVEEFQRCDPISPRLRPRRGPTPIYSDRQSRRARAHAILQRIPAGLPGRLTVSISTSMTAR
jgi:hypothetical protein